MVTGSNLDGASVIWDPGTANEKTLPSGYLGPYMFSVPPDALPGSTHSVALKNASGLSNTVSFAVVAASVPFPKPRIDHVTLLGAGFDDAGHVNSTLYVQGANFDVGAVVLVNGVEVATTPHKGLRAERYGLADAQFGYPIYHYVAAVAVVGSRSVGDTLNITVRNLDAQVNDPCAPSGAPCAYVLPMDAASMDSDGDSLRDVWESNGYDATGDNVVDVDLRGLGADPLRRDVLLEIDVMDNLVNPPDQQVFDALRQMFRSAPILNPTAENGINLIIDASGKPCLQDAEGEECSFGTVRFDVGNATSSETPPDPFATDTAWFSVLKAKNFQNAGRGLLYHYGIWGIAKDDTYSGESDFADDFVVTFDTFPSRYATQRSRIETLAHELGHDLGLRHAGEEHQPLYKPTYWSVMGYNWDLRTGWKENTDRTSYVTCLPFYYGVAAADEIGGAVPNPLPLHVDYSEGMGPTLIAASGASATMCGKTFQWDTFEIVAGTVKDFADWRALLFDGPQVNERLTVTPGITP
jgi:hypothetical protein